MRVAIMQPYFLPYIGYFQLIERADRFVIYDDIQFSKKGWIHRNRFLRNGEPVLFTLPLSKGSDYLDVRDRCIADAYSAQKMVAQISNAYRKAPQFASVMPLLEEIFEFKEANLFAYVYHSVIRLTEYLEIETPIVVSSALGDTTSLKGQDRVMSICQALEATTYINPIGGLELYSASAFRAQGIELQFMKRNDFHYDQFGKSFVPDLSILDVLMFNTKAVVRDYVTTCYSMVEPNHD